MNIRDELTQFLSVSALEDVELARSLASLRDLAQDPEDRELISHLRTQAMQRAVHARNLKSRIEAIRA